MGLGLGEAVVCFHVLGGDGDAGVAVGYDGLPVAKLEAGSGAVGIEGWVVGVGDDAIQEPDQYDAHEPRGHWCWDLRFGVEAIRACIIATGKTPVSLFLEL